MSEYRDRWISASPGGLRIRAYYFPWGTKQIPWSRIRSWRRVQLGALTGRGRIWGTANPRYWASLDPKRATKSTALILDTGRRVHPYLTPDDPDALAAVLTERTGPPGQDADRGPIV